MPTLNTTPNRAYQEPAIGNDLAIDVGRIVSALRAIDSDMADALAQIVGKAGLASPSFTGAPTAPTALPGTETNQLATTAFVAQALASLIDTAPDALNTLNELAAALGDDPNFSATVLGLIAQKADASATTVALAGKEVKSVYAAKSANYTAVAADDNAVLRFTSAATLSLAAAATLGTSWRVTVVANGGAVTIDPNGSETINGLTTMIVPNGTSAEVICSGSAFFTVMRPSGWQIIERRVFSGVQAVDFTSLGDFKDVRFRGVVNFTGSTDFIWRSSTNNGSSFDAGASDYQNQANSAVASSVAGARLPASYARIANGLDAIGFELEILNFSGVVGGCVGTCNLTGFNGGATTIFVQQTGHIRTDNTARNAIRFAPTTAVTMSGYIIAEGSMV